MINLLPPEVRTGYQYARRNVGLRTWVIMSLLALVGLGIIATYGVLTLRQTSADYQHQIDVKQASLKKEDLAATQKSIRDISNSFKLVVKVLGQEVLFSKLLQQIATTIPAKANLTALNISQTTGAIDITANATDYTTATQVQVNLADPKNQIFSRADIISIDCGKNSASDPNFPCLVSIRALFGPNNRFLFINSQGKAKP